MGYLSLEYLADLTLLVFISRKKKLKKKKRKKKKGKKDTVKDKDLTQSDNKEESANPKPKKVLDFLFI